MCFSSNNCRTLVIKLLVFCLIYSQQLSVSSLSVANKTGKSSFNRKNDKFYRYFNKIFDELSTPGSELRQSIERNDQKLNITFTVSDPRPRDPILQIPSNEFTDLHNSSPNQYRPELSYVKQSSKDCQCSCDPYAKANQLINEYVMSDDTDPNMDVDDNEELEKLQRPYKYIPMETIELAHQRPQRVTTTPGPPTTQHKLTNLMQSMSQIIRFPKLSTNEALELGLSLAITGLLGTVGLQSLSPYPMILKGFRRTAALNNHNNGYYNNFYSRQFNDTEDLVSLVYQWIQSLNF